MRRFSNEFSLLGGQNRPNLHIVGLKNGQMIQ